LKGDHRCHTTGNFATKKRWVHSPRGGEGKKEKRLALGPL